MSPEREEIQALTEDYLHGLLEPEEARRVEALVARDGRAAQDRGHEEGVNHFLNRSADELRGVQHQPVQFGLLCACFGVTLGLLGGFSLTAMGYRADWNATCAPRIGPFTKVQA